MPEDELTKQERWHRNRLESALRKLEHPPIPDSEVKWLRMHRPSVAFLLCICSGPWRIGRRTQVQKQALKALGSRDLCTLSLAKASAVLPLAWQRDLVSKMQVLMHQKYGGRYFDEVFTKAVRKRKASLVDFQEISRNPKHVPKVLYMFVRDFWFETSFPVDTHVRKWLVDNKLPTDSESIVRLYKTTALSHERDIREYARALFGAKSSNPIHPKQ